MPRAHQRETYSGRQLLLPELRMVGFDSHRSAADLPLDAHEHPDAYEICLTLRGSVAWWVGREIHESGPGEVYITHPGERHGAVDAVIQPCDLYWVSFACPRRGGRWRLAGRDAEALSGALEALRLRVFRASADVARAFEVLCREHREPQALGAVAARAALFDLLANVVRDHARAVRGGRAGDPSPLIRRAMDWALSHLGEEVSVATWARTQGLSATRFHERFRTEVGFSPADWRMRQRVHLAKRLLREGDAPVTEIAMRCGFTTSQYFATRFKRLVGVSPRDYRAARPIKAQGTSL